MLETLNLVDVKSGRSHIFLSQLKNRKLRLITLSMAALRPGNINFWRSGELQRSKTWLHRNIPGWQLKTFLRWMKYFKVDEICRCWGSAANSGGNRWSSSQRERSVPNILSHRYFANSSTLIFSTKMAEPSKQQLTIFDVSLLESFGQTWQSAKVWSLPSTWKTSPQVSLRLKDWGEEYTWNKVTSCLHNLLGAER